MLLFVLVSSVCCSEEVLQELTFYGWVAGSRREPSVSL